MHVLRFCLSEVWSLGDQQNHFEASVPFANFYVLFAILPHVFFLFFVSLCFLPFLCFYPANWCEGLF